MAHTNTHTRTHAPHARLELVRLELRKEGGERQQGRRLLLLLLWVSVFSFAAVRGTGVEHRQLLLELRHPPFQRAQEGLVVGLVGYFF